ncbi:MAG: diphosphomevalonate decarboxylase [Bradymonadia bacterium]|jgi:diphosphomevalonate decarboxylase
MTAVTTIAHPNIALIKYWGKRDASLNLPAAGSLSVTLGPMHTRTTVSWGHEATAVTLNGADVTAARSGREMTAFLELIKEANDAHGSRALGEAHVLTENDFPTAAGLASSSSGYAALALGATKAAGLELDEQALSVLARRGSGSASRSVAGGVVEMRPGEREDGTDANAVQVFSGDHWDLRVVVALTTRGAKDVASRDGMNQTAATSPYFTAWVDTVAPALIEAKAAIAERDFARLALAAEASAMQMHASAIASVPGVLYWNAATVAVIHAVRRWRGQGVPAFFTIDAGPHVKIFTLAGHEDALAARVRELPGVLGVLHAAPADGARVVPLDAA